MLGGGGEVRPHTVSFTPSKCHCPPPGDFCRGGWVGGLCNYVTRRMGSLTAGPAAPSMPPLVPGIHSDTAKKGGYWEARASWAGGTKYSIWRYRQGTTYSAMPALYIYLVR